MNEIGAATQGAATEQFGNEPEKAPGTGPGPTLMGATTLVGDAIFNEKGERLGELKQVMLDMHSGRIAYAVLSSGGFLSIGSKLLAVPWNALRLDTGNKRLVLDVEKEMLESAPGFDPDRWPDMADPIWSIQIHSYYGTKRYDDGAL